jgi:hypothetical protein
LTRAGLEEGGLDGGTGVRVYAGDVEPMTLLNVLYGVLMLWIVVSREGAVSGGSIMVESGGVRVLEMIGTAKVHQL